MDNNKKYRRAIVYDLGIEELKHFYVPLTKKPLTRAYEDLAKVLHDLDFEHRQYILISHTITTQ